MVDNLMSHCNSCMMPMSLQNHYAWSEWPAK